MCMLAGLLGPDCKSHEMSTFNKVECLWPYASLASVWKRSGPKTAETELERT